MSWKDTAVQVIKDNGTLISVYRLAGGLSEFWALVFGVSAVILEFRGKLEPNFAATIIAIQGLLCAHDALDDYHSRKRREDGREDFDKK